MPVWVFERWAELTPEERLPWAERHLGHVMDTALLDKLAERCEGRMRLTVAVPWLLRVLALARKGLGAD